MSTFSISDAVREKSKKVLKDALNLRSRANDYNTNYSQEIKEGTEKRQLLLTEGLSRGLTPDSIDFGPNFIPSEKTPVLNFLFFTLRDEFGGDITALREEKDLGKDSKELLEHYNKQISDGPVENKLDKFENPLQPNLGKYIYGDVDVDMFEKIKKLKSLSNSPNESEAFSAYRMAKKLCEKHKLDFDRIPCDN
jgi:hypothetical protein